MRKVVFWLACMLLMCGLVWSGAAADGMTWGDEFPFYSGVTDSGLVYVNAFGEIMIEGYIGDSGHVVIPASIDGYPVIECDFWFYEYADGLVDQLELPERPEITSLDISECKSLQRLDCMFTSITSLDVTNNKNLKILNCRDINIASLDISQNIMLNELYCRGTKINSIDLSNNPSLETVDCSYNNITQIDISKNQNLKSLNCSNTPTTSINFGINTNLEELNCKSTNITSLDVSRFKKLVKLYCSETNITTLDVSHNPDLKILDCSITGITSLDVSNNPSLERLYCYETKIKNLDVSQNEKLENLDFAANHVTNLDVSKNPNLKFLGCYYCDITSLDLSNNKNIAQLWCFDNDYPITTRTLDLTTLPGHFDPSKASNWQGGTVNGHMLTLTADEVTYDYDCGQGYTATFTLIYRGGKPTLPADTDHDGTITLADTMPYLSGSADVDANGDGVNNVADAVHVLKYLCGYGVTLE